jgi:hypothetical protein
MRKNRPSRLVYGPLEKVKKREFTKSSTPGQSDPSQPILTYFGIWTPMGHETTGAKFGRSRSRDFGATRGAIFSLSL